MPHDADFYHLELLLDDAERELLHRVRTFMEKEVAPVINRFWVAAQFPHELVPGLRDLGIAGLPYRGYGCGGARPLLDGLIALELARTDPSIATFMGVHGGLAMGSIYVCGSEEQRQRWLPVMARMEKIGAFGLTEPDVGSGAARGLTTTARRDGDAWVLRGQKNWIGNATFADLIVIWAKDVEDGQVKGFVVEKGAPGLTTEKLEDKIALRVVQNARITLDDVRVPESDRLANARSFRDTAEVLRLTRAGVAWMAVGCGRGAYEHALAYATRREQFGRPDRRLPAGPRPAGADAGQHHRLGRALLAAGHAAGGRAGQGRALRAGQGVLHGADAGDGRLGARTDGRQRHPAGVQRGPVRGRRRGHLLLRGHPRDEHPDRGPHDHRAERLHLGALSQPLALAGAGGAQAAVQEADHPAEALVRVLGPLEAP